MSKMYKRNAGNTAWDEVKKGFKVRSGSRWVSPKIEILLWREME